MLKLTPKYVKYKNILSLRVCKGFHRILFATEDE